ncbi:MAG: hypothetical protein OEQ47_08580 [Acidimicrobiia bacterium]|nr:hypothetical protein [Acidimicrobiia bacterium]
MAFSAMMLMSGFVEVAGVVWEPVAGGRVQVGDCSGEEARHLPPRHRVVWAIAVGLASLSDPGGDERLDRRLVNASVVVDEGAAWGQLLRGCGYERIVSARVRTIDASRFTVSSLHWCM